MYAFACEAHDDAPRISEAHEPAQSGGAVPHSPVRSQIDAHASSTA
jgi:hypothetical protein